MDIPVGSDVIEAQIRRWELTRKKATIAVAPCLAISRLPGTPAAELGQRVAERLGYGFFGIEIVDEIARSSGIHRYLVEQLDEHVRSGLDRYFLVNFEKPKWCENEYLFDVGKTIAALGHKGGAVILGRGAPFLLTDAQALKVRIVASRGVRTARLASAKGLDTAAAQRVLRREERERLAFLREFVDQPDDPLHFDLVINSDRRNLCYWTEILVDAVTKLSVLGRHGD